MPIILTKSSEKMGTGHILIFEFSTYATSTMTEQVSNDLYEIVLATITIHTKS